MPPSGPGGAMPSLPAIGRVYGKITDSVGRPVRDASVMVLQNKIDSLTGKNREILLKGITTRNNGEFNIEGLPITSILQLKITAVGYETISTTVRFEPKMPTGASGPPPQGGKMPDLSQMAAAFERNLGTLKLVASAKTLESVVVTASSTKMRLDIDKKVFNVLQNIVSAGGTAVDVMRNVPGVNVDMDGNASIRNATPQIYIDGRPTTLSLDQIPADGIESVEVITSPSARYDAAGGNGGILNLVLKKNKKSGYNGNISLGVDKRGGLNGGLSFSMRQNKLNFSLSGFGNQMKNRTTGTTFTESLLTTPALTLDQTSRTRNSGGFLFGKAGVDYFVTNRTTISANYIRVHGSFKPAEYLQTDSAYKTNDYISYNERTTDTRRTFDAHGFQAGVKFLLPQQGEELTADVNIFSGKSNSQALYHTDTYAYRGGPSRGTAAQQILGEGDNRFMTVQADYVKPLGEKGKLEAGARVQVKKATNKQGNYYYNATTGNFEQLSASSTNYESKDNVYAAYLSFSQALRSFAFQVGLRAERSDYTGELTDTKESFSNKYPISLFPSLFLSKPLKDSQELQLSYTRRVNRPFFMQVIPFIDSSDQLNWSRGNAGLQPEFTHSLEAAYSKTFSRNHNLLFSVYYKYSTDLITRYLDTVTVGGGKYPVYTYINARSSRSTGAELTMRNVLAKWWEVTSNINVYNSRINTDNISSQSQDGLWSVFVKLNQNFKLPAKFKLQLSGTYQSKTNLPVNQNSGMAGPGSNNTQSASQGYVKSNYGVDAAIQRSFLKKDKASVIFSVSDIFSTRRMDQYSASNFYIQQTHKLGDVPMFKLTFAYQFGQMDMAIFKRKNTKTESEGMQGAMQGIGQ